jgi:hypothetical protein
MNTKLETITKDELINRFIQIESKKWIKNERGHNDGAVGNTLEDLLGIPENNLPIPNAVEWELKAQRANTSSLITLFHMEPSPRALKLVPSFLLPSYGWPHQQAGLSYPITEKSFRQTLNGLTYTDRGFKIDIDDIENKVIVVFNSKNIDASKHLEWLKAISSKNENINEFSPQPYWGFQDLFAKAASKLTNCFYVQAETKKENGTEFFYYNYVLMLKSFSASNFASAIRDGKVYVDFDARTGHNHGTKFRIKFNDIPSLYKEVKVIISKDNI